MADYDPLSPGTDRRRASRSPWTYRRGGFWRNPLFVTIIAPVIAAVISSVLIDWYHRVQAANWRAYGAEIAAQAQKTNDVTKLRDIVREVQKARPE